MRPRRAVRGSRPHPRAACASWRPAVIGWRGPRGGLRGPVEASGASPREAAVPCPPARCSRGAALRTRGQRGVRPCRATVGSPAAQRPGLRPRSLTRPPAAGRPEPASLSRSPAVMVADQRLPRVPAEPGTIPRLCALLLGAGETKRKCQEHVNQTRYSVTITSLSGLPGPAHPSAPRSQAGHLRGALAPALSTDRSCVPPAPKSTLDQAQ